MQRNNGTIHYYILAPVSRSANMRYKLIDVPTKVKITLSNYIMEPLRARAMAMANEELENYEIIFWESDSKVKDDELAQ